MKKKLKDKKGYRKSALTGKVVKIKPRIKKSTVQLDYERRQKEVKADPLDSQEFYELMQAYRHTPVVKQAETASAFEAVKQFIRHNT